MFTSHEANEVQSLSCLGGSGFFKLSFKGDSTGEILFDASFDELVHALQDLHFLGVVTVDTSSWLGDEVCGEPAVTTTIEFLTEHGSLPLIVVDASNLSLSDSLTPGEVSVIQTSVGTKKNVECSGRGICDELNGRCNCFVGYQSGDGQGNSGERGDCSYRNVHATVLYHGGYQIYENQY